MMKIYNTISAVLQLINQMPAKPAHNFMTNLDLSFTSVVFHQNKSLWDEKNIVNFTDVTLSTLDKAHDKGPSK